jgi:hypothetical protein
MEFTHGTSLADCLSFLLPHFLANSLRASVTVFPFLGSPGQHYEGTKTKLIVSYKFSRFITGRLIYTTYDGGGRNSTYGQYDKWDHLGWEVSYEF